MSRYEFRVLAAVLLLTGCFRKQEGSGTRPERSGSLVRDSGSLALASPASIDGALEAHRDEPEEHEELPSKVRLSSDVAKAAGVALSPVVSLPLPATVNLTGEVVADPDRAAKVVPRVSGRIVDVQFKDGQRVKAGAVMVVIESPELARARADHATARARAGAAKLNLERLERVATSGLAAGQEVANARAEANSLEAGAQAARQTLLAFGVSAGAGEGTEGARLAVRAPIEGFVLRRDAIRGQTVTDAHVLAEIANLDRAFFLGRLFEKDLARVKAGAAAEVRLNAYPGMVLQGTVESIGKQLDPAARTVVARIAVTNHEDLLKVGLFGAATVVMTGPWAMTPKLAVPLGAVTKIAGRDVVFVKHPDGDYEVHPVTLGRSAAGRVEVLSGLREGEQVVVEGVFTLKSVVLKSTFGEED